MTSDRAVGPGGPKRWARPPESQWSTETELILETGGIERQPIGEQTRRWLCVIASGDFSRPLPSLPCDWDELFRELGRNGLLGLADQFLVRQAAPKAIPPEALARLRQSAAVRRLRLEGLYRASLEVLETLAASRIDALVVKGMAVAHTIYPDPGLRSFSDLDIVVRERSWSSVHRLLLDRGFVPEEDLPNPPPKLLPQSSPYEWKYWHPKRGLLIEVHYEDLYNAGIASRDIDWIWQQAVEVDVRGRRMKVMSLEDQLVHLCAHAHYHGFTRLCWLSDLAFLLRDHDAGLDWNRVQARVRREELHVPVYYSLLYLERLLDVSVPRDQLAQLRPDAFRRRWHEHYLPTEAVLSLQPMPRPDFSFYFLPLFKRLLPDLLVMGRRREKLCALPRVLFPSDAWLTYYYRTGRSRSLLPHRFTHPLKLAYHYAVEMAVEIGRALAHVRGTLVARRSASAELV